MSMQRFIISFLISFTLVIALMMFLYPNHTKHPLWAVGDCLQDKLDPERDVWQQPKQDRQYKILEVGQRSYLTLVHFNSDDDSIFVKQPLEFFIEDMFEKVDCDLAYEGVKHAVNKDDRR